MQKPPHRNGTTAANPSFTSRGVSHRRGSAGRLLRTKRRHRLIRRRLFPTEMTAHGIESVRVRQSRICPGCNPPVIVIIATADGME